MRISALDRIGPIVASEPVFGYRFGQQRGRVTPDRYWCNLGSIDAYFQANMALLLADPPIDLYQDDWNIRTYQGQYPPARTVPGAASGTEGIFVNSMLAAGTVISGGGVNHSILYPRVRVRDGAIVDTSILFDGVRVGEGPTCATASSKRTWRSLPGSRSVWTSPATASASPSRSRGSWSFPRDNASSERRQRPQTTPVRARYPPRGREIREDGRLRISEKRRLGRRWQPTGSAPIRPLQRPYSLIAGRAPSPAKRGQARDQQERARRFGDLGHEGLEVKVEILGHECARGGPKRRFPPE